MPAVLTARAVLLKSVDYGEADRIVTFLTDGMGKLSLMARGARRSRRRFAGALEPFAVLRIELSHGRGQLGRLVSARIEQGFVRLLGSLARMQEAGRALEMVRALVPEAHSEAEVFEATIELLAALDTCDEPQLRQWRLGFAAQVIHLLGIAPGLRVCGGCGRTPGPSQPVQLDVVRGHIVCRACGGAPLLVSPRARMLLLALAGPQWRAACEPLWPDRECDEVDAVVTATLRAHDVGERGRR